MPIPLSEWLEQKEHQFRLTESEMAKRCQLPVKRYRALKNGKVVPQGRMIRKIAELWHIKSDDLARKKIHPVEDKTQRTVMINGKSLAWWSDKRNERWAHTEIAANECLEKGFGVGYPHRFDPSIQSIRNIAKLSFVLENLDESLLELSVHTADSKPIWFSGIQWVPVASISIAGPIPRSPQLRPFGWKSLFFTTSMMNREIIKRTWTTNTQDINSVRRLAEGRHRFDNGQNGRIIHGDPAIDVRQPISSGHGACH